MYIRSERGTSSRCHESRTILSAGLQVETGIFTGYSTVAIVGVAVTAGFGGPDDFSKNGPYEEGCKQWQLHCD
jgi:hypothetical protein